MVALSLFVYRYAMENCIEMDADFRLAEHEMTGWDQADVSQEQLL